MHVLSIVVCPFVLFLLAIVLSVLFRYTVSDCPFGIFKLFLSRVRVALSFVCCVMFVVCSFSLCLLAIVLSVLTSFEYPFSIFKLFLCVLLN